MPEEKRKHWRFSAKRNVCATFSEPKGIGFQKVGQILDMGMGGMSLRYVSEEEAFPPGGEVLVELFGITSPFITTGKICCTVIYDHPLSDFPGGYLKLRRCGLQFRRLSQLQSYNIGHFIETFSLEEDEESLPRTGVRE